MLRHFVYPVKYAEYWVLLRLFFAMLVHQIDNFIVELYIVFCTVRGLKHMWPDTCEEWVLVIKFSEDLGVQLYFGEYVICKCAFEFIVEK